MDIKFRAWDGKLMHQNVVIIDGVAYKRGYFANIYAEGAKAGKPMQFVGLWDDSGKEIYDGDIVELHDNNETKRSYTSRVYFYHDGAVIDGHPAHVSLGLGGMRKLSHYCGYGFGGKFNVSCRIIGNIYESEEVK